MKRWERYFYREIAKVFFLFLFCFYGLYVLIDFSSHAHAYRAVHFGLYDLMIYYGCLFIQKLEILIPFALLLSSIKVLCQLNLRNELVALMASGVSLKRLMYPFLIFSLIWAMLLYSNFEWVIPHAMKRLSRLEDAYFSQKNRSRPKENLHSIELKDKSVLLYHSFDSAQSRFFDVYWIRSIDHLFKIKFLDTSQNIPLGHFVEEFVRGDEGNLIVLNSDVAKPLTEMDLEENQVFEALTQPKFRSMRSLFQEMSSKEGHQPQVATAFIVKVLMPWLGMLAVLGVIPYCVRFTRQLPVFFIYLGAMLALVVFYLGLNAAVILGENAVIQPQIAIGMPFLCSFLFIGGRCLRL